MELYYFTAFPKGQPDRADYASSPGAHPGSQTTATQAPLGATSTELMRAGAFHELRCHAPHAQPAQPMPASAGKAQPTSRISSWSIPNHGQEP